MTNVEYIWISYLLRPQEQALTLMAQIQASMSTSIEDTANRQTSRRLDLTEITHKEHISHCCEKAATLTQGEQQMKFSP